MAEGLTNYLKEVGIKVTYLHYDVKTLERREIIRNLRLSVFSMCWWASTCCGRDRHPEVSLWRFVDADKEGFLRAERSLIQTIGRAARTKRASDHV